MSASLNKVMLLGNLTRDPEIRYTPKGTAVGDLGLALNRRVKNGDQWEDQTTFVDVTVWGRTAENCDEYLTKGRPVLIEGRLQVDTWEDKETGQKRSRLKVVAEQVQFLPAPLKDQQKARRPSAAAQTSPRAPELADDDVEDDIPF
jgi:single-strand DNA-binding protein